MSSVNSVGFDFPGQHEPIETKEFSFADSPSEFFENLLDIINPLQHIPVVSTVYQAITGDQIAAPARLIGGALFGGPIGFASTAANMMLEEASGDDLVGHALAFVGDLGEAPEIAAAPFTPLAPQAAIDLAATDGSFEAVPEVANVSARAAAVAPPASQVAASKATAGDGVEIIWNGPRVLPSLARAPAVQSGPATNTAVEVSVVEAPANVVAPGKRNDGPVEPANTSATRPALGGQPSWIGSAITDAQSVQDASQLGKAGVKVEAQPWITDAMLDALNKYETLTRERNR